MRDDIRPRGTVEVQCSDCTWWFWVNALDERLPDGPFKCPACLGFGLVDGRPHTQKESP